MKISKIILFAFILLFALLPGNSNSAPVVWEGSGTYEIGSGKDWFQISELHTYDDVTVKMYAGGGVNQFSMYDNSELIKYDSSVAFLYLYDNATASLFGGSSSMELYIDPANTGLVKLYADFDRFEPYGPYGEGHVYGYWLANDMPFSIKLVGQEAYSKVQFIPEPVTLFLLGLGGLSVLRNRRR